MKVKRKRKPMRMCIGCKEMKPKNELTRVVRTIDETIEVDLTGKKSGRGAYICKNDQCIEMAAKANMLSKALHFTVTEEIAQKIKKELPN